MRRVTQNNRLPNRKETATRPPYVTPKGGYHHSRRTIRGIPNKFCKPPQDRGKEGRKCSTKMRMSPLATGDAYRLWRLYTPRKGQPHCSITGWRTHISINMRPISSKRGQGYLARQRQGPGEPYPYRGTLATPTSSITDPTEAAKCPVLL